jgi:hypothetical protein
MNTLRTFIRESLQSEAVGQTRWIRTARGTVKQDVETAAQETSRTWDNVKGFFAGAASVTSVFTRGKGFRVSTNAWRNAPKGAAGVALGVTGIAALLGGKKDEPTDDDLAAATQKFSNFIEEIRNTVATRYSDQLKKMMRTPEIATRADSSSVTDLVPKFGENYNKKSNIITNANSYDEFFPESSGQIVPEALKGEIDKIIQEYSTVKDTLNQSAEKDLKSVAHHFMVSSCVEFLQSAMRSDILELESIGMREGSAEAKAIEDSVGPIVDKLKADPEVRKAKADIEKIMQGTL